MWQSRFFIAILGLLIIFSSISNAKKVKDTIITTISKADSSAAAAAAAGAGNGSAAAGAAAAAASSASVTTIIKTHHHSLKKCAVHEKYVKCPAKLCQPQVCDHVGYPLCSSHGEKYQNGTESKISHDEGDEECHGPAACVCVDNYVRDDEGVCIPVEKCPSCGGDKNSTFGCGVYCGRRCSNYLEQNVTCPEICYVNSCDCKDEYVFDDNTGNCVLPEDCSPQPQCPDGERYEENPDSLCAPLNCSQIGLPIPLDLSENSSSDFTTPPGCVCKNDNVRDDEGNCVPRNQCPLCGGDPNATAGCSNYCGNRCSDYNQTDVFCPFYCETNGCACKQGFVYDDNLKKCVQLEDCTPICEINEVYDSCANGGCRRWNCSDGEGILCIDARECEEGCVCQKGYSRAENGTCIPEDQCPTEQCNKPHEYYDSCAPTCPPQTCESIGNKYECPAQTINCTGACRCDKGYYRNKNNDCITAKQCTCDNICATLNEQNQTNCPIKNIKCNKMCYCMEGYARNDKKICIPIDQCPKPQCPDGERYEENPDSLCAPLNCSQIGFPITCPASSGNSSSDFPTPPGCVCENDNVRDDEGNCVPRNQCPSCGGDPNATAGCSNYCGNQCSDYNQTDVVCLFYCETNGCACKQGFVYDDNLKKCVQLEECTPTCESNEVYDSCANGGCRRWNCSDGEGILCIDPSECEEGCVCQKGYSRAENGTCIPEDQCPTEQCNKPHEYYDSCAPTCPPQTCESIGKKYECPAQTINCTGACRCEKGYYRNKNNDCKTAKQCKKCTGPNEYYACGGACDNVCATLNEQNQTNCPIKNIKCNKMCYCMEGYARNDKKICIPIDQCPKPQCPDGERYEENPDSLCAPLNCSQIGLPLTCPASSGNSSSDTPTPPGCVCKNDNVRDDEGNCVPRNQCPSCGGDPNATAGCSNYCGNRCYDYNQTDFSCPFYCDPNGCACKQGFVYDDNLKKCVQLEDCTPICEINEVYDSCANGGCRRWNCSDGESILCIDPSECEKGCVCQKGFSRAENGTCIPEDQCPTEQCNNPHEYYDSCAPTCPPQTCESIGKKYRCPAQTINCTGACRCEKGYYRNKNNACITAKQCKKCTGPNEYYACGGACDNVCATLKEQNQTNCPVINIKCNKMCYCMEGYARNDKKICIPIDQCRTPTCGINEVYDSCANGGCRRWKCSDGEGILCIDPSECEEGCVCQKGYSRAENGTCIPEHQCPTECPEGERYEECPDYLCSPLKCSHLGLPLVCPGLSSNLSTECPGEPACVCDNDYVRDDDGNCIPKDKCPSCGGDENAVAGCGINCGKICANKKKNNITCILLCKLNACECKKGHVYDDDEQKCVPDNTTTTDGTTDSTTMTPTMETETPTPDNTTTTDGTTDAATMSPTMETETPTPDNTTTTDGTTDSTTMTPTMETETPISESSTSSTSTPTESTTSDTTESPGPGSCSLEDFYNYNASILANLAFGAKILSEEIKQNPEKNLVISGSSILYLLPETVIFTSESEDSTKEILKAVALTIEQIKCFYPKAFANLDTIGSGFGYDFMYNLYADVKYKLTQKFVNQIKETFTFEPQNINFSDPDAVNIINNKVANRTGIENFVKPDILSSLSSLVFADAKSFRGEWEKKFDPKETTEQFFYRSNFKVVKIPMMYQSGTFLFAENRRLGFKLLRLNYKGEFSCAILLPDLGINIETFVTRLSAADQVKKTLDSVKPTPMEIYIPKFNTSTASKLKQPIIKADVKAVFNQSTARLKDVAIGDSPYVSEILQKISITIDETGSDSEADFSNTDEEPTNSLQYRRQFKANRPFVYFIFYRTVVILAGVFTH